MTTYWFSTQNLKCVHFLYLWLQVEDQSPFALAPILDGHGKPQSFCIVSKLYFNLSSTWSEGWRKSWWWYDLFKGKDLRWDISVWASANVFVVFGLYMFIIVVEQGWLHLFIYFCLLLCMYLLHLEYTNSFFLLFIWGEEVPFQLEFNSI
jgi:hypothetical protein